MISEEIRTATIQATKQTLLISHQHDENYINAYISVKIHTNVKIIPIFFRVHRKARR